MSSANAYIPKSFPLPAGTNPQLAQAIQNLFSRYLAQFPNPIPVIYNEAFASSPFTIPGAVPVTFLGASSGSGADFIANLPAAVGSGDKITVQKSDSNAHNIVLTAAGSDTINGSATYDLTTQYQTVEIIDTAAGFWTVA